MIQLQFAYSNNIASALIKYFGHGAGWSHVDAVLANGGLLGARHDVFGTIPAGVQIRPSNYKKFDRTQRIYLPTPVGETKQFYDFLNLQLGKPYDTRAIIAFAYGSDWRAPSAWFCSELIARALEVCGWFPFKRASPVNKIDPDDLYLAISAREAIA